MKLEDTTATPLGSLEYEPSQTIAELGAAYLVSNKPVGAGRYQTVEVLGGLRYNEVSLRLTGPLVSVKGDQEWLDPFIGLRYRSKFSPRWLWGIRGDIGGFGIGDASDFTWNLILSIEYELSRLWGLYFGWRWLDIDYDTGSGESRFEYDILSDGPFLGFQYRW